jgi:hypothetical protein
MAAAFATDTSLRRGVARLLVDWLGRPDDIDPGVLLAELGEL